MKISAAFKDAFRVYAGHFGTTLKFLAVEGCITLAAFTPLLFLTDSGMKMLALLAVPFYLLLLGLYIYCFRSVKKTSKTDADDLTVAAWLVSQRHPEFREMLAQLAAAQGAVGQPAPGYAANGPAGAPAQPYPYAPAPGASVPPQGNTPGGAPASAAPYRTAFPTGTLFVGSAGAPCENYRPFRLPNGDCYCGEWKDGLANGLGTYYFSDGRRVSGMWVSGRTY